MSVCPLNLVPRKTSHLIYLGKQVTRGHKTSQTGGQERPTPIYIPRSTFLHTHKNHLRRLFSHFWTHFHKSMDGLTDQQNKQMDKASYRVACPQLKKWLNLRLGIGKA